MIGWLPASAQIDMRKLRFLHRLCTCSNELLVKQIFNFRLFQYFTRGCQSQTGFIPNICNILVKYELMSGLQRYMSTGVFLSKHAWKIQTRFNIDTYHKSVWQNEFVNNAKYDRFKSLHTTTTHPAILWDVIENRSTLTSALSVAKLWTF